MKILVTGAHGQLGRELCRQIGPAAVGIDCDTLDLADADAIEPAILAIRPDLVLNAAAFTQVDLAEKETERCRSINAVAVERIAATCRRLDAPLLQVSTDYVFFGGPDRRAPFREAEEPSPRGVYAETKLAGERAATAWTKHWIVRTCGLYARRTHVEAKNFVKTILRLADERPRLRVVNDQRCTPSYVPHVAEAILKIAGITRAEPAPWGIYHTVNGGETTWYEFAVEVLRLAGKDTPIDPIPSSEYPLPAPRPAFSVLDAAKYHSLGTPEMPSWQSALHKYFTEP